MKSKQALVVFAMLLSSVICKAEERHLSVPDVTIPSGGIVDLRIDLEDQEEWTICFDAELELPEGFEVLYKTDKPETPQFTVNYARNSEGVFNASYPYKGKGDNNDVRFIYYSTDNSVIKDATGWIVKFPLLATTQPGTYEARIHSIHISNKSFVEIDGEDIIFKIIVTEPVITRYTDNQLFCDDIEINQGENAELKLSYNSSSEIYEYAASIILPSGVQPNGNVNFTDLLTSIEDFTNNASWDVESSELKISGEYGGRRADPAPSGTNEFATVKLNTSSLVPGEYQITITNQVLSNDDDDYTPENYIGYITVRAIVESEKCATPVITIEDNKLIVHSDTEGAIYHTSITAMDHQEAVHVEGEYIELTGRYLVTSYASVYGYADSDPITATLVWNKMADITSVDEVRMEKERMVMLQSVGDAIVVHGVESGEAISLYDLSGTLLFRGEADADRYSIPCVCEPGKLYIVRVGADAIKYRF